MQSARAGQMGGGQVGGNAHFPLNTQQSTTRHDAAWWRDGIFSDTVHVTRPDERASRAYAVEPRACALVPRPHEEAHGFDTGLSRSGKGTADQEDTKGHWRTKC